MFEQFLRADAENGLGGDGVEGAAELFEIAQDIAVDAQGLALGGIRWAGEVEAVGGEGPESCFVGIADQGGAEGAVGGVGRELAIRWRFTTGTSRGVPGESGSFRSGLERARQAVAMRKSRQLPDSWSGSPAFRDFSRARSMALRACFRI